MVELAFGIAAYASCGPQSDSAPEVCYPKLNRLLPNTAVSRPVPTLLRRRVTPIGRAVLRAAWALPDVDRARFVFASRHGEFQRTVTMLNEVADDDGPTPADFSLSVHNALAGLLSVCSGNRRGHTALAAGVDSFGFGLMEAAACVAERPDEPVMLAYYDEGLPEGYPDFGPAFAGGMPASADDPTFADDSPALAGGAGLAFAAMLTSPDRAAGHVVMTATPAVGAETGEAACAAFLRFLKTGVAQAAATGERMNWTWRHV